MSQQLVTATVEDGEVRIVMPDGSVQTVPHQSRAVAGILLAGWVDARVREWSHGEYSAAAIDAQSNPPGPTSLGQILDSAARADTHRFSLRPRCL